MAHGDFIGQHGFVRHIAERQPQKVHRQRESSQIDKLRRRRQGKRDLFDILLVINIFPGQAQLFRARLRDEQGGLE